MYLCVAVSFVDAVLVGNQEKFNAINVKMKCVENVIHFSMGRQVNVAKLMILKNGHAMLAEILLEIVQTVKF